MAVDEIRVCERLKRNGWKFRRTMERIFQEYNHPFEDDLIVNLEDMTVDAPSGPVAWCPIDSPHSFLRKQARVNRKKKSGKYYAPDESLKDLMSTELSDQADRSSEFKAVKDEQCMPSMSKLQTSISIGNMNVGDKYKIDVDMLATGHDKLGKQVLVECVGKTKDKPLIMFTPTSRLEVGLLHVYHDCSDDFQTSISGDLNNSSRSKHDDQDDSHFISSVSNDCLSARSLCELGSKEVAYPLRLEENRSNVLDLEETVSTCINQDSRESHDDSSGLSDTTLIDIYPSMLASMSNLLNRSYKTQTASRLIKHYRRLQLNVCKSKLNTTQDGIRMKGKMDVQISNVESYPIIELEACNGTNQVNRNVCSLKKFKTTECNFDSCISVIDAEGSETVQQTNSKSSETKDSNFSHFCHDAINSRSLPTSPCNPISPVLVTNCCNVSKTSSLKITSNESCLPQLDTMINSSFKCLSPKPNLSKAQSPYSRNIFNHLPEAQLSPSNNSMATKRNSIVNSKSPFRMLLHSSIISCTAQKIKRRHSFSSTCSVPGMFHSIQSPLKTPAREMDAFESVYQSLAHNSFSFPTAVKLPNVLNASPVPGRTVTSVTSVTNSSFQLSRKRAACTDQIMETSRLPLKRFCSLPESSSSRQDNPEMLTLNTILQGQNYHCTKINGFYSPGSQQQRGNLTVSSPIKWEDICRKYSSHGTVLPIVNSSGNTVSLCLSPRLRNRVSRKLVYNKLNTPV
ncbi:uncharacterized protein LOC122555253 isoform X1 [Chiloscyllium plagiosum]|uniref:uncharacterized protein LOC122555253 isoform X1 n=3 Tax=Chiloscyllium plagiosum TaxID=36176 RepID=UPI001CB82B2B|nr:uncharacterized protein LOC122555253 isoform X1 [Chiloscyllium plagiosum]